MYKLTNKIHFTV